jgi:hypothetical protein
VADDGKAASTKTKALLISPAFNPGEYFLLWESEHISFFVRLRGFRLMRLHLSSLGLTTTGLRGILQRSVTHPICFIN